MPFPPAVPEIPVAALHAAVAYYVGKLGFTRDWGEDDGIAGISRGDCRLFLTDAAFRRATHSNAPPIVIWLNLDSKAALDAQFAEWQASGAKIVAGPADMPWKLREFTAADLDGNLLRVFYDFSRDA
ncbi:MAG: VOC family protein [Bryobacterales bacterium]|nr:VOC family protein [Bryobacterales bacterium]